MRKLVFPGLAILATLTAVVGTATTTGAAVARPADRPHSVVAAAPMDTGWGNGCQPDMVPCR